MKFPLPNHPQTFQHDTVTHLLSALRSSNRSLNALGGAVHKVIITSALPRTDQSPRITSKSQRAAEWGNDSLTTSYTFTFHWDDLNKVFHHDFIRFSVSTAE